MTNQATQQRVGVTAATQRSPSGTGLRMPDVLFAEKKSRSRFSKYQSGTVSVWEKVKADSEQTHQPRHHGGGRRRLRGRPII